MKFVIKKTPFLTGIILLFILVCSSIVHAGPFIEIISVEPNKDYPLVKMRFSVKDIDTASTIGLEEEHISVFEDGYKVARYKVQHVSDKEDYLYLVFSIDSSKSISQEFLHNIKAAAKDLAASAGPTDKIAVYTFNDNVHMLNNFTDKRGEIIRSINKINRTGKNTLLFNSIFDSIDLLTKEENKKHSLKEKKVIVFTDGKDEGSSVTSTDVIKFSRETKIPIYFICNETSQNKQKLSRIAKLSGGKLVVSKNSHTDIARKYKTLLSSIKSRYEVLFDTFLNADGKKHLFEVRIKYKEIRDRDSINTIVKKSFFNIELFKNTQNMLVLLIGLLIFTAITGLIMLARREKKYFQEKPEITKHAVDPKVQARLDKLLRKTEKQDIQQDQVLKKDDPEYAYANAWLVQREGPESGKKYPLYWEQATIGRGKDNTIVINDDAISLNHAKIKNVKNIYHIFDLVSENGTFLNGKKLLRPKSLHDWDEITIGRTRFIFRGSRS